MKPVRLTRTGWLDLGLEALAAHGPAALKLAEICKAAGVTRGSFYHHFTDHGEFLEAMVRHRQATEAEILAQTLPAGTAADTAMEALTDLAMGLDYRLELGLRELARVHGRVDAAMAEVDAARVAIMAPIYAAIYGISEGEARDASLLEYATFLGLMLMDPDRSETEQRRLYDVYLSMQRARYAARTT